MVNCNRESSLEGGGWDDTSVLEERYSIIDKILFDTILFDEECSPNGGAVKFPTD